MVSPDEQRAAQIKTLHGLLDRLCSPDLTLEEAKVLRNQLLDFLERINPLFSEASTSDRHGNDPSAGKSQENRLSLHPGQGSSIERHPAFRPSWSRPSRPWMAACGLGVGAHLHEPEPLRAVGVPIDDYLGIWTVPNGVNNASRSDSLTL